MPLALAQRCVAAWLEKTSVVKCCANDLVILTVCHGKLPSYLEDLYSISNMMISMGMSNYQMANVLPVTWPRDKHEVTML